MITNSKGKRARAFARRWPTSYCARSPVPVSPITANFTESASRGSVDLWAAGAACAGSCGRRSCGRGAPYEIHVSATRAASVWNTPISLVRREDVGNVVEDDLHIAVQEDHVLGIVSILEIIGQSRQMVEQERWHGGERSVSRVGFVDHW